MEDFAAYLLLASRSFHTKVSKIAKIESESLLFQVRIKHEKQNFASEFRSEISNP